MFHMWGLFIQHIFCIHRVVLHMHHAEKLCITKFVSLPTREDSLQPYLEGD